MLACLLGWLVWRGVGLFLFGLVWGFGDSFVFVLVGGGCVVAVVAVNIVYALVFRGREGG